MSAARLTLAFTELEIDGVEDQARGAGGGDRQCAREDRRAGSRSPGIVASETISGRLDAGLDKLGERAASFADLLGTVKKAVLKEPESDITYDAGVEITLKLTAALELKRPSGPGPAAKLTPMPMRTGCCAW